MIEYESSPHDRPSRLILHHVLHISSPESRRFFFTPVMKADVPCNDRWNRSRFWSSVRDNHPLPFVWNSPNSLPCLQMTKQGNRRGQEQKRGCRNTGEVTMACNLRLSCDATLIPVPSGRRHSNHDFNHSCCQTGAPSEAQLIA